MKRGRIAASVGTRLTAAGRGARMETCWEPFRAKQHPGMSSVPPPPGHWYWIPSRPAPQPPRPGGTAPAGDIPEPIDHLRQILTLGATIAAAQQVWVDGMTLINQRAGQFAGNGPVVNAFIGTFSAEWRVYAGRPASSGLDTLALAFNTRTGAVAVGRYPSGIGPHPAQPGQQALFNFKIIFP